MEPPKASTNSSTSPPSDSPLPGIVVPVHGAPEELDRCLASIGATTALDLYPLLLVVDGPQPTAVERVLERRLAGLKGACLVRSARRSGFAAAANRGIEELAGRDALLLNSDVEVTAGWLERLRAAASSAPRIASVTPLTNHGTLASVPRWFEENALPAGHELASFADLVERISERRYPRAPTGVGFCLYLRRQALDAVGNFDEATFGLGYGEEVDWCLRATALGFEHVLDDATFVFHRGGASFGEEGKSRSRAAQRILERRHPGYRGRIASFTRDNPLRPVLDRIWDALQPTREPAAPEPLRLVHLVHGWPPWNHAGVETYARRLVRGLAARHHQSVYARYAPADRPFGHALELVDGGARVRLVANKFEQRNPLSRNALDVPRLRADFGRLLDEARPDLVHVHHLAGHGLTLPRESARRNIPIVWQLQDWWMLCARANLCDASRALCAGPSPTKCAACLPPTTRFPAPIWGRLHFALRSRLARHGLSLASAFVAGSEAVVASYRQFGLLPARIPVHILDYGVEAVPDVRRRIRSELPLRFGFIGSPMPHKGLHIAARALSAFRPDQATLEIWCNPAQSPAYVEEVQRLAGGATLRFHGAFDAAESAAVWNRIDVLIVPSLGLESYGLVAEEALAWKVPVLASNRGALPDRLRDGGGRLFEPDDPTALAAQIGELVAAPEQLASWTTERRVRSSAEHAAEIEAIYFAVMTAKRAR